MITTRFLLAAFLSLFVAPTNVVAASVSAGYGLSVALAADGTVRTWGDDSWGGLGLGRSLATVSPAAVAGLTNVAAVTAGANFSAALKSDGTVWTWGSNENGQLGDGSFVSRSIPVQVVGLGPQRRRPAGRWRPDGGVPRPLPARARRRVGKRGAGLGRWLPQPRAHG